MVEEELVAVLLEGSWSGDARLNERERAALDYTERFWHDHRGIDRSAAAEVLAHFSESEFIELGTCIAQFMAMGQFFAVLGIPNPAFTLDVEE